MAQPKIVEMLMIFEQGPQPNNYQAPDLRKTCNFSIGDIDHFK